MVSPLLGKKNVGRQTDVCRLSGNDKPMDRQYMGPYYIHGHTVLVHYWLLTPSHAPGRGERRVTGWKDREVEQSEGGGFVQTF
jgi:hypothetical protein